ncbi:hypothetical protein ACFFJY_09275 [Fictibacillus aquaticus]|uniref:Lipoprotein n=1 Tax=Fictibacillus aquaticus TaxID=2021314 RepID=A0A235FAV7_9BACL|nr:hypothetical protein [Fictibacillus aquaticus]OYD58466.1 hypothetical protein CGZ90_00765 [Fictibacillus aquaticus]
MKKLITAAALLLMLTGCVEGTTKEDYEKQVQEHAEKKSVKVPEYEIKNDRMDKNGTYYVDFITKATDEKQLKMLVRHAAGIKKQTDAVFVQIWNDEKVIANAKMAVTEKGTALTGLDEVGKIEFNRE